MTGKFLINYRESQSSSIIITETGISHSIIDPQNLTSGIDQLRSSLAVLAHSEKIQNMRYMKKMVY